MYQLHVLAISDFAIIRLDATVREVVDRLCIIANIVVL